MTRPEPVPRPAASWDAHRPFRRRHGWLIAGLASLVPGLAAVLLRVVPPTDDATALLASFIAYGVPFTLISLICLLVFAIRARRRLVPLVTVAVVAALLAVQVSWRLPDFVSDHRVATTRPFTLISLNLYNGAAAPEQVWRQAAQADVVVLIESTPQFLRSFKRFHPDSRFPYSLGGGDEQLSDTVVYSRFPMSRSDLIRTSFQQWATDLAIPGIGTVRLYAVHPCNPYCGSGRWASEHAQLAAMVTAGGDQPIIMAGDFNAVDDHGPMQQLRLLGMRSAADVAGGGWLPTWPANKRFLPPMIPIDHVLINRQLTATAIEAFTVAGTDHRGLRATLAGSTAATVR